MTRFLSRHPVPITDGADTIYILPKMDFGAETRLQSRIMQVRAATRKGQQGTLTIDAAAWDYGLLAENIVKWEGPGFGSRPFSEDALAEMDGKDPLMLKALEEIQTRNKAFIDDFLGRTPAEGEGGEGAEGESASPNLPNSEGAGSSPSEESGKGK
jgi:hypothetical protein